jgi:hypothetical protein
MTFDLERAVQDELDRLERKSNLAQCLSADNLKSRPTPGQLAIFQGINSSIKIQYDMGGNQCLARDTQVLTPSGIVPIQDIKPGDLVYDENGAPIKVLKVFANGEQRVCELLHRGNAWVEATLEHRFSVINSSHKDDGGACRKVSELRRDDQIVRQRIKAPLGGVNVPEAYAIGALLGDGCSRECHYNGVSISSIDDIIPNKVMQVLDGHKVTRNSIKNYTWKIHTYNIPKLYFDWCAERYAHEKIIDLELVKTWNRNSVLNLVAGVIDADGSVYVDKWGAVVIRCEMQAKSVIEFLQWAFLTLWQVPVKLKCNPRDKYVHGPTWSLKIANNVDSLLILRELDDYLVSPSRKWKPECETFTAARTTNSVGVKLGGSRVVETYDIHVDSPTNLYCLANGMVTHNSGKTACLIRAMVWMLEDTHPFWRRPTDHVCPNRLCNNPNSTPFGGPTTTRYRCQACGNVWEPWPANEPMSIMLVGQNHKGLLLNLWEPRIKPLLSEPDKWKEQKVGPYIGWIQHIETGDRIVFFPHGHGSEQARKALQGFTVHAAFLDELAPVEVIEELQRRVMAKCGFWMAAFTMKRTDPAVLRFMNAQLANGAALQFRLSMLDNPKYEGMYDAIKASLSGLPKEKQDNILYGDVDDTDDKVFVIDEDLIRKQVPDTYSPSWRHVEIVDPAIQSKAGYVHLAQDPATGIWHTVLAMYISGMQDQTDLLDECERLSKNVNTVLRISDNQAWFVNPAKRRGLKYVTPPNKQGKGGKIYLIKKAQMFLSSGRFCCSSKFEDAWYEFDSYRWKEGTQLEIVNSNAYHIIDCIVYFADVMPKDEVIEQSPESMDAMIRRFNRQRHSGQKRAIDRNKKPGNIAGAPKIVRGDDAAKVLKRLGLGGEKWKLRR